MPVYLRVLLAICLMSSVALGQAEADSARLDAKIKQLMEVTGSENLGLQMGQGIVQQMSATMQQGQSELSPRVHEIIAEVVIDSLEDNMGALMDSIIPLYARYFTEEDIDQLLEFYSTATGQKVIEVMPILMQESMAAGSAWAMELMPEVHEQIQKRLAAEGY